MKITTIEHGFEYQAEQIFESMLGYGMKVKHLEGYSMSV